MISQVVFFLLIITIVGIILLARITYEKRPFIFIPAGMIWGVTIYIFLLNLTSKLWPGKFGIILATVLLISLAIASLINYRKHFKLKFEFKLQNLTYLLIISCLILTTIYLARLKMTSVLPVADSNMQWAYAATFARGNYPIKTPWQADLNPNYHLGAYFLEGAILALSKLPLPLISIHSILNTFYLVAGGLFAIFLFWENKYTFRNLWFIIASAVLYVSFGVVMFIFPTGDFLKDIFFRPNELFLSLTNFPNNIFAKGGAGASLVDLNSLSYLPARSLSIGIAFLALYFSNIAFKNLNIKIISFVILFSTAALVEESMFLPIIAVGGISLLISKKKDILLKILTLTAVVVFLQGGFFSDLTTQDNSAFKINLPFLDPAFKSQLQRIISFTVTSNSTSLNWFIPGPFWLAITILIFGFFMKQKSLYLISLFSIMCMLSFLLIEYKYSPSNNVRFFSFASISSGTGFFYLIFMLAKNLSIWKNIILLIVVTGFVLIPTTLPEILTQYKQIMEARDKGIRSQVLITSHPNTPFEKISDWAAKNLPSNARLIVIDVDHPNPYRSLQFQYKGLYTTLSPQYIHTTRPEPGPEFFDLALTLNPSLFKQTKTEYVYIESESPLFENLPKDRLNDLENKEYFQILQSIENRDFQLYKVLPKYLDQNLGGKDIKEGTLTYLQSIIPDGKTVYIADYGYPPKLFFWYRMVLILALKDKDIRRNLSQTDYQAIETIIPSTNGTLDQSYDYYILGPGDKPPIPSKVIWSNIFVNVWERI